MTDALFSTAEQRQAIFRQGLTLGVGAAGGVICYVLGLPGGAMSGATLSVGVLASFGLAAPMAGPLRILAMAISGLSIGSAADPETIRNMLTYPVSMVMMVFCVATSTAGSAFMSRRISGWSRATSLLAGVPGAMAYILSVSGSVGADMPRVVLLQTVRFLFLIVVLPILMVQSGLHIAPLHFDNMDPWWLVALMVPVTAAAGLICQRYRIAGGMMFGAMIVSIVLHATAIAPGRVPPSMMVAGQILIGAWAGSRFDNFDWRLLLHSMRGGFAAILTSMTVSFAFSWAAANFLGVPYGATLLAYAPGGLEVMTMLAFGLGVDPLFVAAHHFARVMAINLALPLVVRWWFPAAAETKPR